jgi:hypothetical protein
VAAAAVTVAAKVDATRAVPTDHVKKLVRAAKANKTAVIQSLAATRVVAPSATRQVQDKADKRVAMMAHKAKVLDQSAATKRWATGHVVTQVDRAKTGVSRVKTEASQEITLGRVNLTRFAPALMH